MSESREYTSMALLFFIAMQHAETMGVRLAFGGCAVIYALLSAITVIQHLAGAPA